ncbi:ubiquitin carboxyl-terminal hydrolase 14 [Mrakia frigida]|uniref:ubiquitin-specific protease UBP14 n=1 Tax=Mrakia frigida TaxID=29902 RepID=UPI003FCC1BCB
MALEICPHSFSTDLSPPRLSHAVHREECTLCFDDQDQPEGVDVCLTCFNGGCPSQERHHARSHFEKSGHPMVVNVRRVKKPAKERDDEEPPLKKLAILETREEDQYDHHLFVKCYACGGIEVQQTPEIESVVKGIMAANSSARQSEVKAWEEDILPCEHTLTLQQVPAYEVKSTGATCSRCTLNENLWLCLTCGSLGCGRAQFGGVGGNGHGVGHFEETGHPLAVKLGTITAEGTADIYCYTCNDAKVDPDLASHLANFGINVMSQTKTEKSMTELQIEHNLKFDFTMTGDDGKELQPLYGPGLTGLRNLGNSCYLASTIQTLFSLPAFQYAYTQASRSHTATCTLPPDTCIQCQMRKIGDGLLSGRYSQPKTNGEVNQDGIKPTGLKALVGKGHEEFVSMRQQDAEEFLQHLLKVLRADSSKRNLPPGSGEPTDVFRFGLEQRLQCTSCLGVRYRVDGQDLISLPVDAVEVGKLEDGRTEWKAVELMDCLGRGLAEEELSEYQCPRCERNVRAVKQTRFATFPEVLVVHMKKFQLVGWVPQKLDIPVKVGDIINLDNWLGTGLKEGEVALPEDTKPAAPGLPEFNEAAMNMLEGMGFPAVRCQRALLATGNSDGEAAMEWLFAHMDDAGQPFPFDAYLSSCSGPSPEQIAMLADMGFSAAQARKAFKETGGDADSAVEWLFSNPDAPGEEEEAPAPVVAAPIASSSEAQPTVAEIHGGSSTLPATYRLKAFISHKGPSVHSGHYVATIQDLDAGSVLFNDEKVVKSEGAAHESLKELAYLYVFEKI